MWKIKSDISILVFLVIITGIFSTVPAFADCVYNPADQYYYCGVPDCPPNCNPKATYNPSSYSGPIQPISVSTDKSTYDHKSTIIVRVHVDHPYPGQEVDMKIVNPSGNVVASAPLKVDSNGDWVEMFLTGGPWWQENGLYTIYVQQGGDQARTNKV